MSNSNEDIFNLDLLADYLAKELGIEETKRCCTIFVIWLSQNRTTIVYLSTIQILSNLGIEKVAKFISCLKPDLISDDNKMYQLASLISYSQ